MPEQLTLDQIADLVRDRLRQSRQEGTGWFNPQAPGTYRRSQLAEAGVPGSILNLLKAGLSQTQRADLTRQGVDRTVLDLLSTRHSLSSGFLGLGALSDQDINDAVRFVRAIPYQMHEELGLTQGPAAAAAVPVAPRDVATIMNAHPIFGRQPAQGASPNALPPAFPVQPSPLTNFPLDRPPPTPQPGMLPGTNPPTSLNLDANRSALADRMSELMTGPQFEGRRNFLAGGQSPLAQAMGLMSGRLQPPPPPAPTPPQARVTPQMLGGGLRSIGPIEDPMRRAELGLDPWPGWTPPSAEETIADLDARTERQREEQRAEDMRRLREAVGGGFFPQ